MSVSTNASGKSSLESSATGIYKVLTDFIGRKVALVMGKWRKLQETQVYFLVFPVIASTIMVALCAAAFNVAANVKLPSLSYYNLIHIIMFFATEYVISTTIFTFHQQSRYQTAWKLSFSKTFLHRVYKDSKGHVGPIKWWLTILLTCFQILSIVTTFYAEWHPTISFLGMYPCSPAQYTPVELENFTASAPIVSGDIDFALIYMYGIPLADGIIAGFAPWPTAAPLQEFHIHGPGPMVIIETFCDLKVEATSSDLNAPFDIGSGFKLLNVYQNDHVFNIGLSVYLPAEAFDVVPVNSTWGYQFCSIHGVLGKADWIFDYQVDKWNMVTAGQAVMIDVGGVTLNIQSGLKAYANEFYNKILATGKMSNYSYDTSTEQSEGTILMDSIIRSILEVTNNTWQYPSQSALFSNLMSWGTEPDGLHHPEHTSRGLAGALGAILHQVFLQYDSSQSTHCAYSGYAGSGIMEMLPLFVVLMNILLGLLLATIILCLFSIYLTLPLQKKKIDSFQYGARIMLNEYIRTSYISKWFTEIQEQRSYGTYGAYNSLKMAVIRVGITLKSLDQEKQVIWIGPVTETASFARMKRDALNDPEDVDLMPQQQLLERASLLIESMHALQGKSHKGSMASIGLSNHILKSHVQLGDEKHEFNSSLLRRSSSSTPSDLGKRTKRSSSHWENSVQIADMLKIPELTPEESSRALAKVPSFNQQDESEKVDGNLNKESMDIISRKDTQGSNASTGDVMRSATNPKTSSHEVIGRVLTIPRESSSLKRGVSFERSKEEDGQQIEWAGPLYLNYKALKKIINSVESLYENNPPSDSDGFQSLKLSFFYKLERELEKVNSFYLQKEAEFKVRLMSLIEKKKILKTNSNLSALNNLKEAFLLFQLDLAKLQKFVEVNAMGFRKILKKWDKRAKSSTKELYLSRQIDIQPCFNNEVLSDFTDLAASNIQDIEIGIENGVLTHEPTDNMKLIPSIDHVPQNSDSENELCKLIVSNNFQKIREFSSSQDQLLFSRLFLNFVPESSIEVLIALLEKYVNVNFVEDINNRTCVHIACIHGRLDVLKLCVERGAELSSIDLYGRTCMHYAAMYGHSDCVTFILENGLKVFKRDIDEFTPLTYAITNGHVAACRILLDLENLDELALCLGCRYGRLEICNLILERGANVGIAGADGLFPIHLATRSGHVELLKILISHGAAVDVRDTFLGWTPLFYAASEGHLDCVKTLLEANCKLDLRDDTDWLPWTYAIYHGHSKIAKLLKVGPQILKDDILKLEKVFVKPMAPSGFFEVDSISEENDEIPSLLLPPPIIPFRIYGHNYLDNRFLIQIGLQNIADYADKSPITLLGDRQYSSVRLEISGKPDSGIPFNVILPLSDDSESLTFLTQDRANFSIQFDVYPTFGSKLIGRAVILGSQLGLLESLPSADNQEVRLALFDTQLRVIGDILFHYSIINPFVHPSMQIGGTVDTYWKTTKVVTMPPRTHSETSVLSFVTASSLVNEYLKIVVQVSHDGIPFAYPEYLWDYNGINLPLCGLSGKEVLSFAKTKDLSEMSISELKICMANEIVSLEDILRKVPIQIGIALELKYATKSQREYYNLPEMNINKYIDAVLKQIYDEGKKRALILMSYNPSICIGVNWKQPNHGVFFNCSNGEAEAYVERDDRCLSIKRAVKFVKENKILGMKLVEDEEEIIAVCKRSGVVVVREESGMIIE